MNIIEVKLLVDEKIVTETLNRIGVGNLKRKILFPSCYLWKADNKYYIVHFKQIFQLTRSSAYNNLSEDDRIRTNAIIFNLKNWKLIDVDDDKIKEHNKYIFVLPHNEKNDWTISHKVNIKNVTDRV